MRCHMALEALCARPCLFPSFHIAQAIATPLLSAQMSPTRRAWKEGQCATRGYPRRRTSWKDVSFVQGLHRPSNVLPERLLFAPVLDGLYIVSSVQETCTLLCPRRWQPDQLRKNVSSEAVCCALVASRAELCAPGDCWTSPLLQSTCSNGHVNSSDPRS